MPRQGLGWKLGGGGKLPDAPEAQQRYDGGAEPNHEIGLDFLHRLQSPHIEVCLMMNVHAATNYAEAVKIDRPERMIVADDEIVANGGQCLHVSKGLQYGVG